MTEISNNLKPKITCSMIKRYRADKGIWEEEDYVILENSYQVWVNDSFYGNFCCTPEYLEELVTGNLAVNKMINSCEDIKEIKINDDKIEVFLNELTPKPYNSSKSNSDEKDFFVYAQDILELMTLHLQSSELHKMTGAVHIMSIADKDKILATREDVGRHNAVDKLYGYCLRNNIGLHDKMLMSSGRITHEICFKAFNMGIRLLVSRSAVTSLAREFALDNGMTLIGFTRGERFNIYTFPKRVRLKE